MPLHVAQTFTWNIEIEFWLCKGRRTLSILLNAVPVRVWLAEADIIISVNGNIKSN